MGSTARLPNPHDPFLFLIPLLIFMNLQPRPAVSLLSFNYTSMGSSVKKHVIPQGNVSFNPDYVDLFRHGNDPSQSPGRVYHEGQLFLWDSATNEAASFNSSFTFSFVRNGLHELVDGLTFFLLDPASLSQNDQATKRFGLGLLINDTHLNYLHLTDNHVGLDVDSIVFSASYPNLNFSSSVIFAWVDYSSSASLLEVYATNLSSTKPTYPLISYSVNLALVLPEYVIIGFSVVKGASSDYYRILSWSFSSTSIGRNAKATRRLDQLSEAPAPIEVIKGEPITVNVAPSAEPRVELQAQATATPASAIIFLPLTPSPSPLVPAVILAPEASVPAVLSTPVAAPELLSSQAPPSPPAPKASVPAVLSTPVAAPESLSAQAPEADYSGSRSLSAGAVIAAAIVVVGLLLLICCGKRRRQAAQQRRSHEGPGRPSSPPDLVDGPRKFNFKELSEATNHFGNNLLLGEGGFGSVYKGVLAIDKSEVAVKRIKQGSAQGEKEFFAEVTIISRIRHKNLVQLKGWCRDKSDLLLVYEYLSNGSLDHYLFGKRSSSILDWNKRYNIVCGLGFAIQYLHELCEKVIVHRDIKVSNVMLDANYSAKLGDFGLARQLGEGMEGYPTLAAGTPGYMAPELHNITGRATTESDVYSYGVVLLVVVCGHHPIDPNLPGQNEVFLVDWVWDLYSKGNLKEAVDARLQMDFDEGQLVRTLIVGLSCTHPDPKSRPPIRLALEALQGRVSLPTIPTCKPVAYYGPPPSMSQGSTSSNVSATSSSTCPPMS